MVGPEPQGESLDESPSAETPSAGSSIGQQSNVSFAQQPVKGRAPRQSRMAKRNNALAESFEIPDPAPPRKAAAESARGETPAPKAEIGSRPTAEPKAIALEQVLKLKLSASVRQAIDVGREIARTERLRGYFGTGLLLLAFDRIGRDARKADALYAPRFLSELIARRAGERFSAACQQFYENNRLSQDAAAAKPEWFSRNFKAVFDTALSLPRHDGFIAARHVIAGLLSFEHEGAVHPGVSAWQILFHAGIDREELLVEFVRSLAERGPAAERAAWQSLADRHSARAEIKRSDPKRSIRRGPLIPGYGADAPTGRAADDCLDLGATVDAMANLIASPELEGTISLGVFGHWGAGKSFFMRRLRGAIDELTQRARREASADAAPVYWPNVAQVEFNAWHYVDANLWASLMSHLLDVLRRWGPDEVKPNDSTGLRRAIEKLEITSAARDEAVRREQAATKAKMRAEQALKDAEQNLGAARAQLVAALASSLWSFVDKKVGRDREEAATILRELGLLAGHATESVQPIFGQIRELTTTGGRMNLIAQQLLRSKDSGRELLYIAGIIGLPLIALLIVWANEWWQPLQNATAVLTASLLSCVAAATKAVHWVRKHAVHVMDKLSPLMAIRSRIEHELAEAETARAKRIAASEQKVATCTARVAAAAAEVATRDKEVRDAVQAVSDAVSGRAVRQFIEQRLAAGDYQKHLGLIATIRRDFEQLSELIRAHNATRRRLPEEVQDIERALRRARPDITPAELSDFFTNIGINRVVLYIDDLDRCPSNRVVEVLQAIHLLLSFPIFVVVVGVDSRWMAHSLAKEYPALLTRTRPEDAADSGWSREARLSVVTTSDYLEKIFQIPFWIPPLTASAAQKMIEKLVAANASDAPMHVTRSAEPNIVELKTPPDSPPANEGSDGVTAIETKPSTAPAENAVRGQPAAKHTITPPPVVTLRPEILRVHEEERLVMATLAAIIGRSPRATKRFVNSYRLLKAALTDQERERFGIVDGEVAGLAAPMFLLAVVTGVPSLAAEFVAMLPANPSATAIHQLCALASWAAADPCHAEAARRIQDFARSEEASRWSALAGAELQPWVSRVTQFSFEDLLPAEGVSALAPPAAAAARA